MRLLQLTWTLVCVSGLLIRGGQLSLSVDETHGQLTSLTASLPDGKTHSWYSSPQGHCLWQATLQNSSEQAHMVVDCFDLSSRVTVAGTSIVTLLPDYGVEINLTLSGTEEGISALFSTSVYKTWILGEISFQLPLRGSTASSLFVPKGWGMIYDRIFALPEGVALTYPSSQATMQFCALLDQPASLYLATHDPTFMQKQFRFEPDSVVACDLAQACQGVWWLVLPLPYQASWTQPFPIMLAALSNNGTSGEAWFDAATVYRQLFVEQNSALFAQPNLPAWFRATPLVINSGWSPYDVLEAGQGDPATVLQDALEIRALFPTQPILFHWYVWYAGAPNFDLEYPDCYFPEKEGFVSAVKKLQALGIQAMPYFNGRLFDTTLPSFPSNRSRMIERAGKLHVESYGNGEKFAVPCPSLTWWRDLQTDLMTQLVLTSPLQALYIDQLAAAPPLLCTSQQHNHTPGGGAYFAQGNLALLAQIRQQIETVKEGEIGIGEEVVLVTENNAEPYLSQAHGFLTVANWFTFPRLDASLVPAFQAVHRALTLGRVFDEFDLISSDWLCEKAAQQFVFGSMQGWISWRGLIGLGDLLPKYPQFIQFLNDLLTLRVLTSHYFIDFRLQRPPILTAPLPSTGLYSAVWGNSSQAALFLLNPSQNATQVQLSVDLPAGQISQLFLNGSTVPLGSHPGGAWAWQGWLLARDFRCFLVD